MARLIVVAPDVEEMAARLPAGAARGTSREAIARAVAFIATRFGPERVVLFGSRASGTARPTSDVDLLVVLDVPEATPVATTRQAEAIRAAVELDGPARLDVTVRTPEQIRVGLAEGDFFIQDMVLEGITLHGLGADGAENGPGGAGGEAGRRTGLGAATREWIEKAEADCRAARYLLDAPTPFLDAACFSAQQCAEKCLKGLLQERGVRFGRIHDLTELAEAAGAALQALGSRRDDLEWLSGFAVAVRYPGRAAEQADADRALAIAGEVRRLVRGTLGLSEE